MDNQTVEQAIFLSKSGRRQDARKLLRPVLEVEPKNEKAWLWYANSFDTLEDKIKALQNCLINCPDSKMAKEGLSALQAQLPRTTSESAITDASSVAFDLQKETIRFTNLDADQNDQTGGEEQPSPTQATPNYDPQAIYADIDQRLGGSVEEVAPYNANETKHYNIDLTYGPKDQDLQATPPGIDSSVVGDRLARSETTASSGHGTGENYRTPFILAVILGAILILLLAGIIAIIFFTQ